jgi:hypothetical protein
MESRGFGEFFSGAAVLWASGMNSQPEVANSNRYSKVVLKNAEASLNFINPDSRFYEIVSQY